jgi:DNA-binding NarL/FixJ family response regulator
MERKHPRLLIADHHRLLAEACKKLFEAEYDVVGVVNDGQALLRAAAHLKPQVIVLETALPLLNGLDAGQQIKRKMPGVKLVFVTDANADLVPDAFRCGASAYLPKTCAAAELLLAVREVLKGRSYLPPSITKEALVSLLNGNKKDLANGEALTGRQREVLQLLAEGKSMKEAGSCLNLTPRTVAFHKYRIMNALGIKSSAELVQYAMKNHIIAA